MASRPAAPSLVKLKHRCRRALFCRQHREVIVAASCILKVDRDIRTNDVSAFAQAISERRQRDLDTHTLFKSRRPDREPADHRYRRLLRSRGARRYGGRTAQQHDELTSPHRLSALASGPQFITLLRENAVVHHSKSNRPMTAVGPTRKNSK